MWIDLPYFIPADVEYFQVTASIEIVIFQAIYVITGQIKRYNFRWDPVWDHRQICLTAVDFGIIG